MVLQTAFKVGTLHHHVRVFATQLGETGQVVKFAVTSAFEAPTK